jgi:hypothetical protein
MAPHSPYDIRRIEDVCSKQRSPASPSHGAHTVALRTRSRVGRAGRCGTLERAEGCLARWWWAGGGTAPALQPSCRWVSDSIATMWTTVRSYRPWRRQEVRLVSQQMTWAQVQSGHGNERWRVLAGSGGASSVSARQHNRERASSRRRNSSSNARRAARHDRHPPLLALARRLAPA